VRNGVGGRFRAGEIPDFTLRALWVGHAVAGTPRAILTHHGFRAWAEGRALLQAYCYGGGAMWAKHAKCGHWPVGGLLLRLGVRWLAGCSPVIARITDRPDRLRRLAWFTRGFTAGLLAAVDRATGHFAPREVPRAGSLTP
jgi:hypothetical protein